MSLNVTIFNAVAPEFSSLSPADAAKRDTLATLAELEISKSRFCGLYDEALALLTAHRMKISKRDGNSGFVASEKVGDMQRSYSLGGFHETDPLDTTSYGQQFLRLRKQLVTTPIFV